MKHDKDEQPILIDTVMKISQSAWNPSGSMFAVCGCILEGND